MSTPDNDDIDLIALIRTLWEFKYVVIAVTGLFGIFSVYIALTATPLYRANVVVAKVNYPTMSGASSLASQFGGLGRLAGFNLGQGGLGQEAQAVLESRRLTEEFIKRYDLLNEMQSDAGQSQTLWRAVKQFRELVLTIREDSINGNSTISIEWMDPETAAQWANDYAALANELIRTRALKQSESNIEYLRKQVEETNVVELERAIYNLIEIEIQTLMLANARDEYAFTVVDPAVAPELRSTPRRKLIVLSGGAIGFILSVIAVLAWNLIRRVMAYQLPPDGKAQTG